MASIEKYQRLLALVPKLVDFIYEEMTKGHFPVVGVMVPHKRYARLIAETIKHGLIDVGFAVDTAHSDMVSGLEFQVMIRPPGWTLGKGMGVNLFLIPTPDGLTSAQKRELQAWKEGNCWRLSSPDESGTKLGITTYMY